MKKVGGSASHWRHAEDRDEAPSLEAGQSALGRWCAEPLQVMEHPLRRKVGKRRRARIRGHLLKATGQRQRLAHDSIEHGTAHACLASRFERLAKLGCDFALAGLRRVESTRSQEQMLDGSFANPGAEC